MGWKRFFGLVKFHSIPLRVNILVNMRDRVMRLGRVLVGMDQVRLEASDCNWEARGRSRKMMWTNKVSNLAVPIFADFFICFFMDG